MKVRKITTLKALLILSIYYYNKNLDKSSALRNIIYQNQASSSQDHRRSPDSLLLDNSYSTSMSSSSCQSIIMKEVEILKRKLHVMEEELSAIKQTRQVETEIKIPILINLEELHHFMEANFPFFISKAVESSSPWLSDFRSTLFSFY